MWNPGPTFFGLKKHCSTIDFIAIPEQLHNVSTAGGPLRKMGRRLQLPNTLQPLDHIPVISEFYYNIPSQASPAPRIVPSEKLDKELMMSGVMQCKGRRNMMADMEAAMKAFLDNESEGLLAQATPDEYFLRLDQIAFEVGQRHYDTKSRYSSCEALYDEWRTTRHSLLDRRRDIRGQMGHLYNASLHEEAI